MKIVKQITVNTPIETVYDWYADVRKWKDVMDDVLHVAISYDDGRHQEFDMTVQRGSEQETVHSIRFCYPYSSIEIFQTKPPPLFSSMSGKWTFRAENEATVVEAMRQFEVQKDVLFEPAVLEGFLERNLCAFKKKIESSCIR